MKLFSALMLLLCQQHSCVVVVDADAGPPIACQENYKPVWCEGNKYPNSCDAEVAGFNDLKSQCTDGDTDGDIICSTEHKPVWCQGSINVKQRKYSNQGCATAVGFTESQCTDKDPTMPIGCTKEINPVWCEGNKYSNKCFAKVAGFKKSQCTDGDTICSINDFNPVWCQGSINVKQRKCYNQCFATNEGFAESQCTDNPTTPIGCTKEFDPVICEGIKYDNLCIAEAAGLMNSQCSPDDIFCEDDETFRKKNKNCTAFLRRRNGEHRANAEERCEKKHRKQGGKRGK